MKVDIENIELVLAERKIDPIKIKEILKDLHEVVEEEKEESAINKIPTTKWEHIVVINDPDKKLTDEFTAWVITQQEGQDSGLVLSKLRDAARDQNEGAKRKKARIEGFGDLFQSLKPKFLKEKGLKIKTKEAVRVITVNGKTL